MKETKGNEEKFSPAPSDAAEATEVFEVAETQDANGEFEAAVAEEVVEFTPYAQPQSPQARSPQEGGDEGGFTPPSTESYAQQGQASGAYSTADYSANAYPGGTTSGDAYQSSASSNYGQEAPGQQSGGFPYAGQPGYPTQPGYQTQPGYSGQPGYPGQSGYPGQAGGPQQFSGVYIEEVPWSDKSKLAAGLFGILLGTFGVHNFYLGFTGKAVAQLLITILSLGMLSWVSAIWGLVEGILVLSATVGTKWDLDAQGRPMPPIGGSGA